MSGDPTGGYFSQSMPSTTDPMTDMLSGQLTSMSGAGADPFGLTSASTSALNGMGGGGMGWGDMGMAGAGMDPSSWLMATQCNVM